MNETEWLSAIDPAPMVAFLQNRSSRKRRLLMGACCRRVERHLPAQNTRAFIEVSDQFADGLVTIDQLRTAYWNSSNPENPLSPEYPYRDRWRQVSAAEGSVRGLSHNLDLGHLVEAQNVTAAEAGVETDLVTDLHTPDAERERLTAEFHARYNAAVAPERLAQVDLIRDIFGNPFRPVALSPEWRTSTAIALAQTMYDSRDFSAMPILADALQDANCTDDAILTHCRGPGPHVRGCWVVDACLSKS
jgi:hypothetical protein